MSIATNLFSCFIASCKNCIALLLSSIPKHLSSPSFSTFNSPLIYLMILSLLSSQRGLASGLKANIAGLIAGKNLSSTNLPLYSVIEFNLV